MKQRGLSYLSSILTLLKAQQRMTAYVFKQTDDMHAEKPFVHGYTRELRLLIHSEICNVELWNTAMGVWTVKDCW